MSLRTPVPLYAGHDPRLQFRLHVEGNRAGIHGPTETPHDHHGQYE